VRVETFLLSCVPVLSLCVDVCAAGKYLSASCTYRGNLATQEVDDEVAKVQAKMNDDFVTWIPNNINSSIISVPPNDVKMSATFVSNTTAIKGVFQRISAQFAKMYRCVV